MSSHSTPTTGRSAALTASLIAALLVQMWLWASHTHPIDSSGEPVAAEQFGAVEFAADVAETETKSGSADDCDRCLRDAPVDSNPSIAANADVLFFSLQHAPLLTDRLLRPWMSAQARGPPALLLHS